MNTLWKPIMHYIAEFVIEWTNSTLMHDPFEKDRCVYINVGMAIWIMILVDKFHSCDGLQIAEN